jgi:hypothetical protein
MVIALIDDGDLDVGARKTMGDCEPSETGADDDHMMAQGLGSTV